MHHSQIPSGYLGRANQYLLRPQPRETALGSVYEAVIIGTYVKRVVLVIRADRLNPSFAESFLEHTDTLPRLLSDYVGTTTLTGPTICEKIKECSDPDHERGFLAVYAPEDYELLTSRNGGGASLYRLAWLHPVAAFLDFCHSRDLCHGSICPDNLLEVDGKMTLALPFVGPNIIVDDIVHLDGYAWPWAGALLTDRHRLAACVIQAVTGDDPGELRSLINADANKVRSLWPTLTERQVEVLRRGLSSDTIESFTCVQFADQLRRDELPQHETVKERLMLRMIAKFLKPVVILFFLIVLALGVTYWWLAG